ncbi:MAG: helicase-related protein [Pseudomonadota bacterium]
MVRVDETQSRVMAVLGPTNTGKTHFAVERMLGHSSGMMGFPLRLLAREIYDRIVAICCPGQVTLITGEEKIGSDQARYIIATVEAMPLHRQTSFLAIDEIQLCADQERGHIFTDRLLHARGQDETMFLGADTMRPLIRRLVPEAEIITRPRFSTLTYGGHAKLTRLPRRSAVVAFSASEVYNIAELIRRQRGGAAVVMGALSPRTRNAQVAMYQSGEVDHLVATDAIGMGLNMDLTHVAFASLAKFDGRELRRLRPPEIGQIAGRAGRHMSDGTFGTTNGCGIMDERIVEAVESHAFAPVKTIRWRNSDLDFRSLDALLSSLEQRPPEPGLVRVRDALDDRSLSLLARRHEIKSRSDHPDRVRLLWQICQIPDFRKTLTEAHLQLLATVFGYLTGPTQVLPADYVGAMIARLDRVDGDIDALVGRISHIRTWTFLSHRADWFGDARHWQELARSVEDRLSDALHDRLTQRFVDRRTSALIRSMRENVELPATIEDDTGEVVVDGHLVGRIEGLGFTLAATDEDIERRILTQAARTVTVRELQRRAAGLIHDSDDQFTLDAADRVAWHGTAIAQLLAGPDPLRPRVKLLTGDELSRKTRDGVERRLERWLERWLDRRLRALRDLHAASKGTELDGPARGIAYRVVERLGSVARSEVEGLLADLSPKDRRQLTRLDLRYGRHVLYLPQLLKPHAIEARVRLWRIFHGRSLDIPPPGRTAIRLPAGLDAETAAAAGFMSFGDVALRFDIVERLAASLRARARERGNFKLPSDLAASAGITGEELSRLMGSLGFRVVQGQSGESRSEAVFRRAPDRPARHRRHMAKAGPVRSLESSHSPFAVLAALKTPS